MTEYKLSNAQKRIWFTQKKYKDSPLFNIGGTVRIKGPVDLALLKQALAAFVQEHTALRLQFAEKDHQVYQYLWDEVAEIDTFDFGEECHPEEAYWKWCEEKAKTVFPMTDQPLYYFAVFRLSDEDKGYFVKIHHILADGWSMKLLTEQVLQYYESVKNGSARESGKNPSYLDFVEKEQTETYEKMRPYWQQLFTPFPELPSLSDLQNLQGKRKTFYIKAGLQKKLDAYLDSRRLSYHTFFTCLYLLYEYKKFGREDVIIGIPLLGRSGSRERQVVGTFTNTMPYRYGIDKYQTVYEMLAAVSSGLKQSFANQKYPYNILYEELAVRAKGAERMYDTCINYYNTVLPKALDGCPIENTEFYNSEQEYALQLIIRHWQGRALQLDFDYQISRYSDSQIEDLYRQMTVLLEQMVSSDFKKVRELVLLEEEEQKHVLYEYNSTQQEYPPDKTWLALFEENTKNYPRRPAVSKGSEVLTYQELADRSNRMAQYLFSKGVAAGDIVAVLLGHEVDTVAAVVAIMKCGAVYLPIDMSTPSDRIDEILSDSQAPYLLVQDFTAAQYNGQVISLADLTGRADEKIPVNLSEPSDLAYLLYTSGSTGAPKGVPISHRNLMNYLCWARRTYVKKEREVFALYSSLAFDFTMTSIFLPLSCGGEIRIYEGHKTKNVFYDIIRENTVTIVKITPSHIPLLTDVPVRQSSLHTFIAGGENLKKELCSSLYRHFQKEICIYNEYGPTEATIGCMTYRYREEDEGDSVPIGQPIANTQIYLLDADLRPVPGDTAGEIYIGGAGLSSGYFHLPEETKHRFIQNPHRPREVFYKTGDMAYRNQEGMLVYCGRRDDEVKLRGHRVNLSEIAAKIMSSTMVQDALVCPVDGGGGVQLCAYLIRKRNYDPDRLKEYLQTQLPPYEVPVFYVALEQFPLTDNGKIDKTKLPEPRTGESETTAVASPFIEVLMAAMSSVIPDRTLTPEDNFYAIGGDSIKAIQISSRLQEKGYELTVRDILLNPVIRSMSTFIKARGEQKYEQGIYEGEIKKTPIISRFFEQHFTEEGYYNQSVLLKFKKVVSVKVLNRAFRDLIRHHDGLRINYDGHTGQLFYNNRHLSCQSVVKSKYSLSLRPEILNKMINKKLDCRFNLKKNLLIRPYYITNNKDMGYLYIIAHHLVIDGVSWRILLEDLASLLEHTGRRDFKLPDKTASYADYAEACSRYAENLRPADSYWGEICGETKGSIPTVVSDRTYRQQKSIHFHLDKVYTRMLVREANKKYDTKPEELLLIALSFALEEMYGMQEVPLDVERHGRNFLGDVNVNRTVGWFTTVFPVRLRMSAPGYSEKVKSIREQLRKTEGRGYEYGIFKYVKKQLEDRQTRICFNYLGEYVQQSNPFFTLTRVLFDNAVSPKNKLESCFRIEAYILEQCLNIYIFYADDLAKIYLPHSFSSCYKRHITDLLEHCVDS